VVQLLVPVFQLHVNKEMIDQAWVVKKPTVDDRVTSLELMDADDGIIVRFFGRRKSGQSERDDRRSILEALPSAS